MRDAIMRRAKAPDTKRLWGKIRRFLTMPLSIADEPSKKLAAVFPRLVDLGRVEQKFEDPLEWPQVPCQCCTKLIE